MLIVPRRRFAAAGGDPNFSSVALLLHAEGTNGSTTAIDSSPRPKTLTSNSGASISTADAKFGTGSLLFSGSQWWSIASNSEFTLTGDFTIEFFVKCGTQSAAYPTAIGSAASGWGATTGAVSCHISHDGHRNKASLFANGNESPILVSTSNVTDNVWHHLAYTRSGNTWRLFVDGNLQSTNTTRTDTLDFARNGTRIGRDGWNGSSGLFNGRLDEIRITPGIARYTSTFTPPTAPFPDA
jgi:hypothetical protein